MALKLLQPAEVTSARLKMGIIGFQGSGKTKTATIVAKGLIGHCRKLKLAYAEKPAAFLDTETGSDWIIPDFKEAGIELVAKKTRSFADLLAVTKEAEQECSVLIIDSLSHFWKELCDSYSSEKAKKFKATSYRLQFQDWAYLKGRWSEFTDMYVNSNLHIILAGRAGFEYDYFEDDEGKKQLEKTGIKMKAEGEMGYEPSLLVQMELCQKLDGKAVAEVWREAHVVKDRSTRIDGKTFINPTFNDFLPHISLLNLAGRQLGVDVSRTSVHAISTERKDWSSTQRKIVLDEIQTLMLEFYPSTSKEDKQAKIALMREHFRNEEMTWTKIEEVLPLVDLRMAYDSMYRSLKNKPSQYAALFADTATAVDIDDEIPAEGGGTAPETIGLRDRLLKDLGQLNTPKEIAHWAMAVSAEHGPQLSMEDSGALSRAIFERQAAIAKNPGNGKNGGGPDDGPDDDGKPPQEAPTQPTKPEDREDRPQATGKGRGARKPTVAQATGTMADLVTAG